MLFFTNFAWRWLNFWLWNRAGVAHQAKEICLSGSAVFLDLTAISLNIFKIEEKVGARGKTVEGASLDGGFPGFLIKFGVINARGKITDGFEWTIFVTFRNDDFFNQGLPHTLNCC